MVIADGGANSHFQHQDGNTEKEEREQIGNEPLRSVVVEDLSRVTQQVTQTYGASQGCQDERKAGAPLSSSVDVLVGIWCEPLADSLERNHLWLAKRRAKPSVRVLWRSTEEWE